MTRFQIVKLLNEIEKKFQVSTWNIDGIDIWPALKTRLFFYNLFINPIKDANPKTKSNDLPILKKIKIAAKQYFKFKTIRFDLADVMYSEAISHYGEYEDTRVNKFLYPIEVFLNQHKKLKYLRTIYGGKIPDNIYKRKEVIDIESFALPYHLANAVKRKLNFSKSQETSLNDLEEVFLYLQKHGLNPAKYYSDFEIFLSSLVKEINVYRRIYRKILKQCKPKLILELCYYNAPNYALNLEAKSLKIPTIEIMHGGIGNLHIAYAGWGHSIPKSGYNILPQKIWLWDEETKQILHPWIKQQEYHQIFVAGNPWLDYLMAKEDNIDLPIFKQEKKKILFTIQFDQIEEYIYDAIQKSPDDYEWWLRMHPRKIYAKDSIINKLKELKLLDKVNIEEANTLPLPTLLKQCTVHISEYSGSIIEAALVGKPSVILSDIGVDTFQLYLDAGICIASISQSSEDLLQKIATIESKNFNLRLDKIDYSAIFEDII